MLSSNTSAVSGDATYIEDVFSTYLYTGNGSTQTITNNIDLSTKGGLVWCKARTTGGLYHTLTDTVTGASKALFSNDTSSQLSGNYVTAFGTTGFSIGNNGYLNYNNEPTVSWTFRKQSKFFDVVTYTGTGSARTIAHNLGSTPGCIIVKSSDTVVGWFVYHRSLGATKYVSLNTTNAENTSSVVWNDTAPTSTEFTVGTTAGTNASGANYVAYIFAHDAGGFGLTGTDNVISCGSFTTDGSGKATVSLGYEPQYVIVKRTNASEGWFQRDVMRGMNYSQNNYLYCNTSAAESNGTGSYFVPTATGFTTPTAGALSASSTYIYIAIRRGPMKVPTDGTKVYNAVARTGTDANAIVSAGFPSDLALIAIRDLVTSGKQSIYSRLTSKNALYTTSTGAESVNDTTIIQANPWDNMVGIGVGSGQAQTNSSSYTYVNYLMRRAPSFFDEVCYTGTGSNTTQTHNLGAVPELMIVKGRSGTTAWQVYSSALANTEYLVLNTTAAKATGSTRWNSTTPTSSVFSIGTASEVNTSSATYVAYLFATCAGVSKVGSYTGTGTTQQVDCGFAAGARFVLIKRSDSTGDWYVWDTARGIVSGNDPYLLLNSTAAEVTITDYIDTYSAGFELSTTAAATVNVIGGSYIFLAIA